MTGDSSHSIGGAFDQQFVVPSRKSFDVEIPSASLATLPNGIASIQPTGQKVSRSRNLTRDSIIGTAEVNGGFSNPPDHSLDDMSNGGQKGPNEDASNPLKRRNVDSSVDYPRRRATIAVCYTKLPIRSRNKY